MAIDRESFLFLLSSESSGGCQCEFGPPLFVVKQVQRLRVVPVSECLECVSQTSRQDSEKVVNGAHTTLHSDTHGTAGVHRDVQEYIRKGSNEIVKQKS